jgi:two-component system nitrate/nitrite response regulator NarL
MHGAPVYSHASFSKAVYIEVEDMDAGTRVLIVSDVRLYREGLAILIARRSEVAHVETCGKPRAALNAVRRFAPDVLLLDVGIGGARALVRALRAVSTQTKILALGLSENTGDIIDFAEAGMAGYVCRDASVDHVIEAIDCAVRQEFPCSREVAAALLDRVSSLASRHRARRAGARLTRREREVASLLNEGLTNKEIARELRIEVATVKNHVHNILEKLGVRTRGEAAARMRENLGPVSYGSPINRGAP